MCCFLSTHMYTHSTATADFAFTDEAAVQKVLELYPDDPSQGVPVNTGDGVLPTGFQDKRVRIFSPLVSAENVGMNDPLECRFLRRCGDDRTSTRFCSGNVEEPGRVFV